MAQQNVALQVAIVYSPYYHQGAQQIFMLQKSRRCFYFLQHENFFRAEGVIRGINNRNLQHNILLHDKMHVENVARTT